MSTAWVNALSESGANVDDNVITGFNGQELSLTSQTKACTELSHFGLIRVSGDDAHDFLQGQVSCDINTLSSSHGCLGLYANLQGRIVANFICFQWQDAVYLRLHRSLIEFTLATLKKHAVFSKVSIEDMSDVFCGIGISGNEIAADTSYDLPLSVYDCVSTDSQIIIAVPGTMPRYEIYANTSKQIQNWNSFSNLDRYSHHAWRIMDMQAGIANIYRQTQQVFLPHRLNYQLIDALNFDKGCYFGQEIIARMHYRGNLKFHSYLLLLDTATAEIGQSCFDVESRKSIGKIVDAVPLSCDSTLALMELPKASMPITSIRLGVEAEPINCQHQSLPYTLPIA